MILDFVSSYSCWVAVKKMRMGWNGGEMQFKKSHRQVIVFVHATEL